LPVVFTCFFFLVCFLLGFFFFLAGESAEDSALLLLSEDGLSLHELLLDSGLRFLDFFFLVFSLLLSPFSLALSVGGGFFFFDFFACVLLPALQYQTVNLFVVTVT
jgi:hypothetical protein